MKILPVGAALFHADVQTGRQTDRRDEANSLKLYNDQRNTHVLNLFIYLLLSYMFQAFFWPIFRGRCTNSAVVQVSWLKCQCPRRHHTHHVGHYTILFKKARFLQNKI
jgi:hypothetical protein